MMFDSEGKPWNPERSAWAIQPGKDNIFYATGICRSCGDLVDKAGKHNSLRNSCPGVIRK